MANILFGRQEFGEWKIHEKGQEVDYNTLPAPTNINRTEPYLETMILASIVTEIMRPKSETTITYSNDGSSKSGVGNFIVPSFIINGKLRALPTLPSSTESVQSLKELEKMTLEILSFASGSKYSEVEIYERIDFVMTDSTAQNLGVIQEVGTELGAESSPLSLVCNVHPLMMIQGKVKSVFKEIHDALGTGVIKECFYGRY